MVDLTDMQLFLFSVDTSQKLALKLAANLAPPQVISPLPTRPARRRLTSKTARTPAYFSSETAESTAALPNSDRQLDKSWHKRDLPRGEGAFECVVPGCGRRFGNKAGLSRHLQISHREGSYRDRTWDLPALPSHV